MDCVLPSSSSVVWVGQMSQIVLSPASLCLFVFNHSQVLFSECLIIKSFFITVTSVLWNNAHEQIE